MYKILGADGRQYGPVSAEQLRRWIVEGRANAHTQTLAEGAPEWKPLGALPEFAGLFAPPIPPTIAPSGYVRQRSGLATAGFIFGLLAWLAWISCCCYGFPCNVLGLIFSIIALAEVNRHPESYKGRGLAIAGLVLSVTSILFYGALLAFAMATGHVHANYYWYSH